MKSLNQIASFFLTVFALLAAESASAQRVNINPTSLTFNADAGQTAIQTIRITNVSEKAQFFQLSLGDWLRDSIGDHQYLKPGTLSRSCTSWISLDNTYIEIGPKISKDIRVTLNAPFNPEQVKEMKWAMLFIQNITEQKEAKKNKSKVSATINEVFRFGIHIYEVPPGVNNFEAKAIDLIPDPADKNGYYFHMKNTGNVMLQCKTHLELINMESGEELKLEEIEFSVFPDATRKVKLSVPPDLKKGKYSVLALLDYNEDMPIEAIETQIEIK